MSKGENEWNFGKYVVNIHWMFVSNLELFRKKTGEFVVLSWEIT